MPLPSSPRHELLAPAGAPEAFFAALEAGADAVYCGLKEFSARAKAKNFTLEEMERLAAYAHGQGRRIYVTLNTLIKEAELPHMVDILAALASFPVDGIILQDLGLWRLAREHFPELPLHASTQMTIHNAAGVKMLEGMGFSRAVLARELSIDEIAAIRGQTRMELEHFIHGALCYSISGHCLFSSYLAGQSGNRGRCAQPCRRRYSAGSNSGFYFSTSDLCAITLLPRLVRAGVMSFKIEGRMKGAEYVHTVVSAYRSVLDARPADQSRVIKEAELLLADAFGRSTTTGLLKGNAPAAIAQPSTRGGIGRQLGVVERIQGDTIVMTVEDVVHVGDRLRIQPQTDLSGSAFTVQELTVGQRPAKKAAAKTLVRIRTPFRGLFQPGDQVYKVATGKQFTMSAEACGRRLATTLPPPIPVRLDISCHANRLRVKAEANGCRLQQEYDVAMEPAAHSPLSREALRRTFAKTGHAAIALGKFTVDSLPPVAIKPSRLNEVRRDFYAMVAQAVAEARHNHIAERIAKAKALLLPSGPPLPVAASRLTVAVKGGRDLTLLEGDAVDGLLMALTPEMVALAGKQEKQLKHHRKKIIWDIPSLIFEEEWLGVQKVVNSLRKSGYSLFRLNNLSHFQLFMDPPKEATLLAGTWLYVVNSQAALALGQLGAHSFSLSVEDDQENMAAILGKRLPIPPCATVYTPIALLTSRIPMRALRAGSTLNADSGEEILLDDTDGLTVARAGATFSLLGHLHELRAMGCGEFFINLSQSGLVSPQGQQVLAAAFNDHPLPGTSLFNFERGLL